MNFLLLIQLNSRIVINMYKYILKRILLMIPIIIGVSLLIFAILTIVPGDPGTMMLAGTGASKEQIAQMNHELGYDQPFFSRYFSYMINLVTKGDFGKSYMTKLDVGKEILSKIPISALVAFSAIFFATIIGTPIGVLSVVKQYSAFDYVPTFVAMFLASAPSFVIGLLLMLLFCCTLHWLPTGGIGSWKNFVLPMLALGLPYASQQMRFTRSSMLETYRQDYIRTARAKGVPEKRVIWHHAMTNALLPVITIVGVNFGGLLGSAIVTETLFSIPGLGTFIVNGIKQQDMPVVMGGIIVLATMYSLLMLLVDLVYAFADPRIKAKYKGERS